MKPTGGQTYRCRNIDSTVRVKISQCPKQRRVTNSIPLMWAQGAVWINKKQRNIIRRIVKYDEIGRSVAIHVTDIEVIADPKVFQHTGTCLRSCCLKGAVTVAESCPDQFRAE